MNTEIQKFLDILDPNETDKIPLSDIVQLFSSQKQAFIFNQEPLNSQVFIEHDLHQHEGIPDHSHDLVNHKNSNEELLVNSDLNHTQVHPEQESINLY